MLPKIAQCIKKASRKLTSVHNDISFVIHLQYIDLYLYIDFLCFDKSSGKVHSTNVWTEWTLTDNFFYPMTQTVSVWVRLCLLLENSLLLLQVLNATTAKSIFAHWITAKHKIF